MTEIELKFQNLVKHDPIRYVVRHGIICSFVEDLKGNKVDVCFFKAHAQIKCNMYNAIYSLGYSRGVEASIKTINNF